MTSPRARLAILAAALVLSACSTPSADTGGSPPAVQSSITATVVPQPTTALPPTPEPSASEIGGGGPQQTPTAIDPCTLMTADQASTMIGVKLAAGKDVLVDQDRECVFESGATRVSIILAPPASDPATAQGYWDYERSKVPDGVVVADLNNLWDRAAYGMGSVAGASISALFVLDGTQAFDLYCQFPACSVGASVTGGYIVDGHLKT